MAYSKLIFIVEDLITTYLILGNVKKKNPILRSILSERNSMGQDIFNYFIALQLQLLTNIFNLSPNFIVIIITIAFDHVMEIAKLLVL